MEDVKGNQALHDNEAREEEKKISEDKLDECFNGVPYKISRHLLISMAIFGMLHINCKKVRWAPITYIYSTFILVILWAFCIRCFFYYSKVNETTLAARLIIHSWAILCASAFTTTYMACRRQNPIAGFSKKWSTILEMKSGPTEMFKKLGDRESTPKRKFFTSFLIASWVSFIICAILIGFVVFRTMFSDMLTEPVPRNHIIEFPLKVFIYVVFVYMMAGWIFSLCFFCSVGGVICKEFQIFNDDFQKAVEADRNVVNIELYRLRHQEICLLTDIGDDMLRFYCAISILSSLVNGMLVIHNLLWYPNLYGDSMVVIWSNIFWMFVFLLYLLVIGVGGGYLNHLAHTPLKIIHNIKLKEVTEKLSFQISMFLNKLTAEPIGLSAVNMFIIDRPTILTIAGAFLSYFLVLLQFQQPNTSDPLFICNCTVS